MSLTDLARPFPQRFVKDNPSGYGSYVQHGHYKQRLLYYVGPYDFELVEILRGTVSDKPDLGPVVVGVVMRLTVTIDGRTTKIEEVGDCELPSNWKTDGQRLKDAMSDALKRCCPHIGLGLSLYNQGDGEYFLFDALRQRDEEVSGAGGADVPTGGDGVPANDGAGIEGPASEFGLCEPCSSGDCQHCWERTDDSPYVCECSHGEAS